MLPGVRGLTGGRQWIGATLYSSTLGVGSFSALLPRIGLCCLTTFWPVCKESAQSRFIRGRPKVLFGSVLGSTTSLRVVATLVKSHLPSTSAADEIHVPSVASDVAIAFLLRRGDRSVVRCSIQLSYGRSEQANLRRKDRASNQRMRSTNQLVYLISRVKFRIQKGGNSDSFWPVCCGDRGRHYSLC